MSSQSNAQRKKKAPIKMFHYTKSKSMVRLPFFAIPTYTDGILWFGNYTKKPIMLFSMSNIFNPSDEARKLTASCNLTFKASQTDCKILRILLSSYGFKECFSLFDHCNLYWTGNHLRVDQLDATSRYQKVNHFPQSCELTRKDCLAKNIQLMQRVKGKTNFDFLPQTYILPQDFHLLAAKLSDRRHEPFILKPFALSRGRGIHIISTPGELPVDENLLASRYISRPLLIDGFKFDIRLYVAATSYDPLIVYVYEEGLVRFATIPFDSQASKLADQCMHLTNYSVNKRNNSFVRNYDARVEDFGNKWSFGALLRYLHATGSVDVAGLMLRIEDIIIKTFISIHLPIVNACNAHPGCKVKCFELYGFDIIIDADLRPWLLEVNLSPSMGCDSPLDFKIKAHMLSDLLNLVGIACSDPATERRSAVVRSSSSAASPSSATTTRSAADGTQAQPPPPLKDHANYVSFDQQLLIARGVNTTSSSDQAGDTFSNEKFATSFQSTAIPAGLLRAHLEGPNLDLLRPLQEEACRSGGWIRILPTASLWPHYSSLWPTNQDKSSVLYTSGPPPRWTSQQVRNSLRINQAANQAAAFLASLNQRLVPLTGIGNHWTKDGDTLGHPNNATIQLDLSEFVSSQRVDVADSSENYSSLRSYYPLHSISSFDLRKGLLKGHTQLVDCYKVAASHLPFYMRKLGDPPFALPGICSLAVCCHGPMVDQSHCGISNANTSDSLVLNLSQSGQNDTTCLSTSQARIVFQHYLASIEYRIHTARKLFFQGNNKNLIDIGPDLKRVRHFLSRAKKKLRIRRSNTFISRSKSLKRRSLDRGDRSIHDEICLLISKFSDFIEHYSHETRMILVVDLLSSKSNRRSMIDVHFVQSIQPLGENELAQLLLVYNKSTCTKPAEKRVTECSTDPSISTDSPTDKNEILCDDIVPESETLSILNSNFSSDGSGTPSLVSVADSSECHRLASRSNSRCRRRSVRRSRSSVFVGLESKTKVNSDSGPFVDCKSGSKTNLLNVRPSSQVKDSSNSKERLFTRRPIAMRQEMRLRTSLSRVVSKHR